jgi:hypothetical protein
MISGSDPAATAAIKQAVDEIIDKYMVGRSRDGTSYHVVNFYRLPDGGMEVRIYVAPEDYPAGVVSTTADNGDPMLQVTLPQYEDTPDEDVHGVLLMDLSFLVMRWLADLKQFQQRSSGGKKARARQTREARSEQARKAARARWQG